MFYANIGLMVFTLLTGRYCSITFLTVFRNVRGHKCQRHTMKCIKTEENIYISYFMVYVFFFFLACSL